MTRLRMWGGRVALLLIPFGVLPLIFSGQMVRRSTSTLPPARHLNSPQVHDWTNRHAIYSRSGTAGALEAARRDPRALASWAEFDRGQAQQRLNAFAARFRIGPRRPTLRTQPIERDWSIYLGTGGTAEGMFPAKFTFDVNATPSCTTDFVVFPVNATPGTAQPNIVAFNQLYSGTSGGNGICNRTARRNIDTGVEAEVFWSYQVNSIGGAVTTSPTISLDSTGSKVAFVESLANKPAHFHVLAWKASAGKGTDFQDVTVPVKPTLVTAAPVAGSSTFTDLALGTASTGSDTLSSPFIDYSNDLAYVGNDAGVLFRIKNVFCTTPSCGNAPPSPDATWGTGGAVTVCSGKLTGPILDFANSTVYVGCSDGKLYAVTSAGVVASLTVGDGTTYGGIVDPPIVDNVNGFVYAVSGSASAGTKAVLVQAPVSLASSVVAQIGLGNQCDLHSPTPNNAYFTSITASGAMMFVGGVNGGTVPQPCTGASANTATVALYGITFNSTTGVMNSAPSNTLALGGGPGYEFAPMTEFFNSTSGKDWHFYSAIQSSQTNVASSDITSGFPTAFTAVTEGIGTSGIIVDNNSSSVQAASIYFNALHQNAACTNNTNNALTGGCAVKLTQAGLN